MHSICFSYSHNYLPSGCKYYVASLAYYTECNVYTSTYYDSPGNHKVEDGINDEHHVDIAHIKIIV